ncbi:hypothetical protein I309_03271 [Cryptococcus deuterogattii LA55]|nr:hypothetical protein I309_03271 [Cryptococcus deuterogattii LA55]KIR90582.1 hypothetical protein I304_05724 [Cryptococcus deuterogattii CBS 10090]
MEEACRAIRIGNSMQLKEMMPPYSHHRLFHSFLLRCNDTLNGKNKGAPWSTEVVERETTSWWGGKSFSERLALNCCAAFRVSNRSLAKGHPSFGFLLEDGGEKEREC